MRSTSVMQSPRLKGIHNITCQLLILIGISLAGSMLLIAFHHNLNAPSQSARILSVQNLVRSSTGSNEKKRHGPGQSTELPRIDLYAPINVRSGRDMGKKRKKVGNTSRVVPVQTAMAAKRVMVTRHSHQRPSIDASRAQDAYKSSIDALTASGHIGPAVAASTAASSKPNQSPPFDIPPRLKRAVELAARERKNGYQLTGGVRPRYRISSTNAQKLNKLRGHTPYSGLVQ